jgi:lysophospholipase L1-like esterase
MRRTLLPAGGILLPAITFVMVCGHASAEPAKPASQLKWESAVAKKLKENAPPAGSIICIGSSHLANWKTVESDLAPLKICNLAIGGSRMKHAAELFIPKLVLPFKPRAVIFYEGSNDLAADLAPEEVVRDFESVCGQLHEALPETRLYVLGIVPSPGKRFERWEAIHETNALLKSACASRPWSTFLDTTSKLLDSKGKPRQECFIPGDIHMTEAGYQAWASVVAPVVVAAEQKFESQPRP